MKDLKEQSDRFFSAKLLWVTSFLIHYLSYDPFLPDTLVSLLRLDDLITAERDLDTELALLSENVSAWEVEPPMEHRLKQVKKGPVIRTASKPKIVSPHRDSDAADRTITPPPADSRGVSDRSPARTSPGERLPIDVVMYQEFVGENGVTGGWQDIEHTHFVRIYNKHTV
jgi:hypothetical protein